MLVEDSVILTGPNFFQESLNDALVTPTGGVQVALADALANASGHPGGSNTQIQFNNNGVFGGIATTGSGSAVLGTSPTIASPTLSGTVAGNLTWSGAQTYSAAMTFNGANTVGNAHSFGWATTTGARMTTIIDGGNTFSINGTDSGGAARQIVTMAQQSSTSPWTFVVPVAITQSQVWSGSTASPTLKATITASGSTTSVVPYMSRTTITDTIDGSGLGTVPVTGVEIDHNYGGSTTKGGRTGFAVNLVQQNGANADSADNFYVGGTMGAFARFSQPGSTSSAPLGRVFGFNAVGQIQSGFTATNYYQVAGGEINYGIAGAGSSAAIRSGLTLADLSGIAQGSQSDNALWFYGGGIGLRYGIMFGDSQVWPLDTTNGTMLGAKIGGGFSRAFQAQWGIDINPVAFPSTGNPYDGGAFRSNGFSVDGAGTVQAGGCYQSFSSTGSSIDCKGSVGTAVAIAAGGSGYPNGTNTMAVTAYGGVWLLTVAAGVVTNLTTVVQPVYPSKSTPANPVTPTSLNLSAAGQAGSGLTINITWNTNATLSLNPSGGDAIVGAQSAIATNATSGFLMIPFCAGAPSGAPTNKAKGIGLVYDTTNHKLMAYDNGTNTWRGVVLT